MSTGSMAGVSVILVPRLDRGIRDGCTSLLPLYWAHFFFFCDRLPGPPISEDSAVRLLLLKGINVGGRSR